MSRQSYRTELEIISDILKTISDAGITGKHITKIIKDAHLSHKGAIDKLEKLVKERILIMSEREGTKVFIITTQGAKFYQDLENFQELTSEIRVKTSD